MQALALKIRFPKYFNSFQRVYQSFSYNIPTPGLWRSHHTTRSRNAGSLFVDSLRMAFPYIWLRDSCRCPECVHPPSQQKLFCTSDIPLDIQPSSVDFTPDGSLHIQWATGHLSVYPLSFLEQHASIDRLSQYHHDVNSEPWTASQISEKRHLFLPYSDIGQPSVLLSAMAQLLRYGLVFFSGVPHLDTSPESCELKTLAAYFGDIRKTFYGETWDVKNFRNSRNIAYTSLSLGLHMDLLYFRHPPTWQVLHCLRNRVNGGTSIFVDALKVASILRDQCLDDFTTLASTPIDFHYINDGHHLHCTHSTIELDSLNGPSHAHANIKNINYSPPFQAPFLIDTPLSLYPALTRFAKIVESPNLQFEYTLREGDVVLFNNRRVLHARTAFREQEDGTVGETNRWLKGCYLEADLVSDRYRMLKKRLVNGE